MSHSFGVSSRKAQKNATTKGHEGTRRGVEAIDPPSCSFKNSRRPIRDTSYLSHIDGEPLEVRWFCVWFGAEELNVPAVCAERWRPVAGWPLARRPGTQRWTSV